MADKITPQNAPQASIEQLQARLAELKGTSRAPQTRTRDKDLVESERLKAGAETYMKYDPETAMSWLDKAENRETKAAERGAKTEQQQAALQIVDAATRAWQKDKENPSLQADFWRARNSATALGSTVKDVVADYRQEQQIQASAGQKKEEFAYKKEADAKDLELRRQQLQQQNAQFYANLADRARERMAAKDQDNAGAAIKNADRVAAYDQAEKAATKLLQLAKEAEGSILDQAKTYVPGSEFQIQADFLVDGWSKAMSGAATGTNEEKMYKRIGDPGFFNPFAQDYGDKMAAVLSMLREKKAILSQGGGRVGGAQQPAGKPKPVINPDKATPTGEDF